MVLISGLGTTNGIRDVLNHDIIAGILDIANSFLGAIAIACGIGGLINCACYTFALQQTLKLFQTCLAIAFGFIIIEIITRYISFFANALHHRQE